MDVPARAEEAWRASVTRESGRQRFLGCRARAEREQRWPARAKAQEGNSPANDQIDRCVLSIVSVTLVTNKLAFAHFQVHKLGHQQLEFVDLFFVIFVWG